MPLQCGYGQTEVRVPGPLQRSQWNPASLADLRTHSLAYEDGFSVAGPGELRYGQACSPESIGPLSRYRCTAASASDRAADFRSVVQEASADHRKPCWQSTVLPRHIRGFQ